MKRLLTKKSFLLMFSILITVSFLTCSPEVFAEGGSEVLKVKGLYIGMAIEEASQQMTKLWGKEVSVKKDDGGFYVSPDEHYFKFKIEADANKKVISIILGADTVDELFNVAGIDGKEFVQLFIDAYKIPKMKVSYVDAYYCAWEFTSSHGYKLEIDSNKMITIKAIPKQNELKFD